MATKKEQVETEVAVKAVEEADKKVADIKAEKLAKKLAGQEKRANWPGLLKYVGKGINWCQDNKGPALICFLTGTGAGVGIKYAVDHVVGKKADEVTEETPLLEEAEEAPFDTEA